MEIVRQNVVQLHIAEQLQNAYDFNDGAHFHERDNAFQLSEREFIKLFRLKKETAQRIIDIVGETHSRTLKIFSSRCNCTSKFS